MQNRRKGRKIYTYRVKNRKMFSKNHPMRSALNLTLTAVILVGLGLVGYNIIGPLTKRLRQEKENPTTISEPYIETGTRPSTTEPYVSSTYFTETTEPPIEVPLQLIYNLNDNVLTDLDKLQQTVSGAALNGYSAVSVPLRLSGGILQYRSSVESAISCGASSEDLPTLQEINTVISGCGMPAVAQICLLPDNLMPAYHKATGFQHTSSDKLWLDDAVQSGGKPYMSPFSDESRNYLHDIASEISDAGFWQVICSGVQYPNFYADDLGDLDTSLSNAEMRKNGLVEMLNRIGDSVTYEFDLSLALDGKEEALAPSELKLKEVCVDVDFHKFESTFFYESNRYDPSKLAYRERTILLMQIAEEITGDLTVYPCIRTDNLTENQRQTVIETLYETGYDKIFIE